MITSRLFQSTKSVIKRLNIFKTFSFKRFATVNSLKDIVKQEIDHEEKNYEAVSADDKNTFLSNSGF